MKEKKETLFIMWISFLIALFLYLFVIFDLKGITLNAEDYLNLIQRVFSFKPPTITVLYLFALFEFFLLVFFKDTLKNMLRKLEEFQVFLIAWSVGESIAVFGMATASIGNDGNFFIFPFILSLISLYSWSPFRKKDI